MKKRKLGIIGGSGLYKMDGFAKTKWKKIKTSWGKPSDEILIAKLGKEEICFIPRHSRGHKINPTNINFRANIDAMKQLGVTDIISVSAVGSLKENLNPGKFVIIDQFIEITKMRDEPITNVVYMGMGEPLNNYASVMEAIEVMRDDKGFGLSASKITVSTVGVIPRMRTLTRDAPGTCLALSLHAPTQEIRKKIVPTATAYPLDELMRCLDDYLAKSEKNSMLVEYCVLKGINDTKECARLLGELLGGKKVVLNFIPYNPTDVIAGHESPEMEDIQAMNTILREEYGMTTTVRQEMGSDIAGACGQLAISVNGKKVSTTTKMTAVHPWWWWCSPSPRPCESRRRRRKLLER